MPVDGTFLTNRRKVEVRSNMQALRDLLATVGTDKVPPTHLASTLASCWDSLAGSDQGGMASHKLLGRLEDVRWQPPMLTFTIERHGGTVNGSTRAELQHWAVNVDECTASIGKIGTRQLKPMAARLSLKDVAAEVADLIVNHVVDERLSWLDDGSVKIQIGKLFPASSGFRRTVQSRRKTFSEYLEAQLAKLGWLPVRKSVFRSQKN